MAFKYGGELHFEDFNADTVIRNSLKMGNYADGVIIKNLFGVLIASV